MKGFFPDFALSPGPALCQVRRPKRREGVGVLCRGDLLLCLTHPSLCREVIVSKHRFDQVISRLKFIVVSHSFQYSDEILYNLVLARFFQSWSLPVKPTDQMIPVMQMVWRVSKQGTYSDASMVWPTLLLGPGMPSIFFFTL